MTQKLLLQCPNCFVRLALPNSTQQEIATGCPKCGLQFRVNNPSPLPQPPPQPPSMPIVQAEAAQPARLVTATPVNQSAPPTSPPAKPPSQAGTPTSAAGDSGAEPQFRRPHAGAAQVPQQNQSSPQNNLKASEPAVPDAIPSFDFKPTASKFQLHSGRKPAPPKNTEESSDNDPKKPPVAPQLSPPRSNSSPIAKPAVEELAPTATEQPTATKQPEAAGVPESNALQVAPEDITVPPEAHSPEPESVHSESVDSAFAPESADAISNGSEVDDSQPEASVPPPEQKPSPNSTRSPVVASPQENRDSAFGDPAVEVVNRHADDLDTGLDKEEQATQYLEEETSKEETSKADSTQEEEPTQPEPDLNTATKHSNPNESKPMDSANASRSEPELPDPTESKSLDRPANSEDPENGPIATVSKSPNVPPSPVDTELPEPTSPSISSEKLAPPPPTNERSRKNRRRKRGRKSRRKNQTETQQQVKPAEPKTLAAEAKQVANPPARSSLSAARSNSPSEKSPPAQSQLVGKAEIPSEEKQEAEATTPAPNPDRQLPAKAVSPLEDPDKFEFDPRPQAPKHSVTPPKESSIPKSARLAQRATSKQTATSNKAAENVPESPLQQEQNTSPAVVATYQPLTGRKPVRKKPKKSKTRASKKQLAKSNAKSTSREAEETKLDDEQWSSYIHLAKRKEDRLAKYRLVASIVLGVTSLAVCITLLFTFGLLGTGARDAEAMDPLAGIEVDYSTKTSHRFVDLYNKFLSQQIKALESLPATADALIDYRKKNPSIDGWEYLVDQAVQHEPVPRDVRKQTLKDFLAIETRLQTAEEKLISKFPPKEKRAWQKWKANEPNEDPSQVADLRASFKIYCTDGLFSLPLPDQSDHWLCLSETRMTRRFLASLSAVDSIETANVTATQFQREASELFEEAVRRTSTTPKASDENRPQSYKDFDLAAFMALNIITNRLQREELVTISLRAGLKRMNTAREAFRLAGKGKTEEELRAFFEDDNATSIADAK